MIEKVYYPRVLVISHNVFSKNTSMGKTMSTFFSGWNKKDIAQLYFHSEIPTNDICVNYYKFTDIDAFKSIFLRRHDGQVLSEKDIQGERRDSTNTGKLTKVYNFGRKRLSITYGLRDAMWNIASWQSKSFMKWLRSFNPEIIFFASGDYEFSYLIALKLANILNVPLVTCCFDDYYLFNKNENSLLGRIRHNSFMRSVKKTMNRSSYIFTVNDLMSEAYVKLFHKECPVLYTATNMKAQVSEVQQRSGISYLGGLGLERDKQLVDIGLTLKEIDSKEIPHFIDVYSGETDPSLLKNMKLENGILFHGSVSQNEVSKIIAKSMAVIHTESFNNIIKKRVMYSLSTKIPDSIASGTCLLAYGPPEVASIDYLIRNNAAFVATNKEELKSRIKEIFLTKEKRVLITSNAIKLANKNHDKNRIPKLVREVLINAIERWRVK